MSQLPKIFSRLWIVTLVCASVFLIWISRARIQRVEYVNGLAREGRIVDGDSPTGYANRQRELIVPERNEGSFERIAQTQQMFAQGKSRVRHVAYDNAPYGRKVRAASPYRWWLGLLAWCDHAISGRSLGLSVEIAALWAEPVLHGLLLIGGTLFVAWRFGGFAAALVSIGFVAIFPFAGGFLPGVPDHHGLVRICGFGSILLILAGMYDSARGLRWFALAGVAGGLGLWVDPHTQTPLLAGMVIGGFFASWILQRNVTERPEKTPRVSNWRIWSASGALTVLLAYLVEYFPSDLGSWHLDSIHPLYGLAWVGAGELLSRVAEGKKESASGQVRKFLGFGRIVLAVTAIAALPFAIKWSGSRGFFEKSYFSVRLTNLPGEGAFTNLSSWLAREGMSAQVWATISPVIAILVAGWLVISARKRPEFLAPLIFVLGPVLVALAFACQQLSWWGVLDSSLLVLIVAAAAAHSSINPRPRYWLWAATVALFAIPGVVRLLPRQSVGLEMNLTPAEAGELIERHLAHWLAKRTVEKDAVVFAPPHESLTLSFYGGLRGIGTFAPENSVGFGTSLMIAGAKSMEEVQGLIQAREIRYIVVPSWDPYFEEFGRLYLASNFSNRKSVLVEELRRLNLPFWLKPLAYPMPVIGGFEKQWVLVFEVVDEQSPVVATSRLAEYLVETGGLDRAASVAEALKRFPGDVGALSARAQVLNAREDVTGFSQTIESVVSRLATGADRFLPWDRRVSLAIGLAQGGRIDLAREQARRCLAELDEKKLRTLSDSSLFKLLVLSHEFGIEITDVGLRESALNLLTLEVRNRL